MSIEISKLLNSSDSNEVKRGIHMALRLKSYFHLLQILKLTKHSDKTIVDKAIPVLIDLSILCLETTQNPPPDAVVTAAVKIINKLNPGYVFNLHNKIKRGTDNEIMKSMVVLKFFVDKKTASGIE